MYVRSPKGGCCSLSDDLSSSLVVYTALIYFYFEIKTATTKPCSRFAAKCINRIAAMTTPGTCKMYCIICNKSTVFSGFAPTQGNHNIT